MSNSSRKAFGLELPVSRFTEEVAPSKGDSLPPWVIKPPPPKITYKLPYVAFCCILYISLNFYLNFTNKYLFEYLDFQYPVLVILLGTTASFFGSGVLVFWEQDKLEWRLLTANLKLIFLLGLGHSLTSGFENLALLRVSLSMTQMVKSLGPGIILVYQTWDTGKPIKPKVGAILLVQMVGAALSVYHNPEFDALGLVYAAASSIAGCVSTIASEKMLKESKMTPTQLTFFSSIPAIFVLVSLMEGRELTRLKDVRESGTFAIFLVGSTAVIALFYSISQFMVVQATGGLYYSLIGNFKTALLVVSAIFFLHESLAPVNVVGVVIGILGFAAYTFEKFRTQEEAETT